MENDVEVTSQCILLHLYPRQLHQLVVGLRAEVATYKNKIDRMLFDVYDIKEERRLRTTDDGRRTSNLSEEGHWSCLDVSAPAMRAARVKAVAGEK